MPLLGLRSASAAPLLALAGTSLFLSCALAACGFSGTVKRQDLRDAIADKDYGFLREICNGEHRLERDSYKRDACTVLKDEDERLAKAERAKQREGAKGVRDSFTLESMTSCGLGDQGTDAEFSREVEDTGQSWTAMSNKGVSARSLSLWDEIGVRYQHSIKGKFFIGHLRMRYRAVYWEPRSGHAGETEPGHCVRHDEHHRPIPCLIGREVGVQDEPVCAKPDANGKIYWRPEISSLSLTWAGAGIPEVAGECHRAWLSLSPDPDELPHLDMARHTEKRYGRDDSCEQYVIEASAKPVTGDVTGDREVSAAELTEAQALMSEGPLYYHACGKTVRIPDAMRAAMRDAVGSVDREGDGIYMDPDGWEPIQTFYEIPDDQRSYAGYRCFRTKRTDGVTWWPW
ncbi:MAG: hypothetical protein EP329_24145 [Deltaproteobacteria bacterium]|nr:MAG: hypothetical protein EP329_24145 [Deltaproteobacteria bacterium]